MKKILYLLTKNPKFAIIVIVVLALVLWFSGIYRRSKQIVSGIVTNLGTTKVDAYNSENKPIVTTVRPTITAVEAARIADVFEVALIRDSTENTALFFQEFEIIQNQADWNAVAASFGTRSDSGIFKNFTGTLWQAMSTYFSTSELLKAKQIAHSKNILMG